MRHREQSNDDAYMKIIECKNLVKVYEMGDFDTTALKEWVEGFSAVALPPAEEK